MHADNHVGTNRLITQETIAIPEILDLIIDNLHDDTKSLRSCSLVSKSWLPSSRYHLFETKTIYVEFYFPEIPSRIGLESFLTFILSSSAIAETVRTLILVGGCGSSWESATLPECDLCDIIAVANKLPFLRHLKLQKLDLTCVHLASMSPYDSFIRLPIAKLSLYGVSIDQSINIIDNFLQHLPALLDADFTGIRLVRLGSHSQHEFMTEQDSLPHSFRSLRVSHMQQHSRAFLLTLFRCGCLSNIANLTLRAPLHFVADGLAALLASQGERLRHLEIDVTYSGDTAPISLSSCTHLTSLTLCLSILPGNSRPSWELAENIVVSLPMKSLSLHSIRFLVSFKSFAKDLTKFLLYVNWEHIDNTLSSFHSLENVIFSLCNTLPSSHISQETGKIIDRLPILAERGVVRVELIKQTIWD